ncbi:MAG: hypothetical protein RSF01_09015 [Bacteroidales bacterium]
METEIRTLSAVELIEYISNIPVLEEQIKTLKKELDIINKTLGRKIKEEEKKELSQRQAAKRIGISVPFLIKCKEQGLIAGRPKGEYLVTYTVGECDRFKKDIIPNIPRLRRCKQSI